MERRERREIFLIFIFLIRNVKNKECVDFFYLFQFVLTKSYSVSIFFSFKNGFFINFSFVEFTVGWMCERERERVSDSKAFVYVSFECVCVGVSGFWIASLL
jgi:hypothetical protein